MLALDRRGARVRRREQQAPQAAPPQNQPGQQSRRGEGLNIGELKEMMRPGDVWAVTKAPTLNLKGGGHPRGSKVKISCATEGASIAYTTETGANARGLLYTGEITLEADATLRAKACRLGYKDSAEVQAVYKIGPSSR